MVKTIKNIHLFPFKDNTKYIIFIICLVLIAISGAIFVLNAWKNGVNETKQDAIQLAEVIEAGIYKNNIITLLKEPNIDSIEYQELKNSLMNISALNSNIRFVYVYYKLQNQIYLLADSEPVDSNDYSFPGQVYYEAEPIYFSPYEQRTTIITDPVNDRWGDWISVLVPIKDVNSNNVIAVLAVDYPSNSWYDHAVAHTIQAFCVFLCIIIIYIGMGYTLIKNRELRNEKENLQNMSDRLSESEILFKSVFNQANIGIAIVDNYKFILNSKDKLPSINPMFEKILGRSQEELLEIYWPDITHPDDVCADLEYFSKFKSGEIDGYDMEKRFIRPDGSIVWIHMIVSKLRLSDSHGYKHLCLIEDISKRKEMERIIQENEQSTTILLDNLPGMMYRCKNDRDWTMLYVSNGCYELTGYDSDNFLLNKDITYNDLLSEDSQKYIWEKWQEAINNHKKLQEEYEIITSSGEKKWVWEQGQAIYDTAGHVVVLEGLVLDITARKNDEIRLKYLSEHDALTGLYNLRYFDNLYTINKSEDDENKSAVVMVNIGKFTVVNSTFGYRFGEKLIQDTAKSLLLLSSNNNILFHTSLDRFVFYVQRYEDKQYLIDLCNRIMRTLDLDIASKSINYSIGVLEIDSHFSYNTELLLKNVAVAADHVGDHKRFGYCFFNKEMEKSQQREIAIREALTKTAYKKYDSSIFLLYQPILNLKTNQISGFEALARYKMSDFELISPEEFIPIAESSQLILPLGEKIISYVFDFVNKLSSMGYSSTIISFNISVIQLLSEDFLPKIENMIRQSGVNPQNLNIEITESIYSDNYKEINEILDEIKKLGIKIAIDDFGTGYSSLARVRELNINYLKIDKHFIDKLVEEKPSESITADIISMAHKLGHYVVAEGVEHEKQKEYLIKNDCDLMQGYLFSEPISEESAIELLKKTNVDSLKS